MPTNDFQPFAVGGSANVLTQAQYLLLAGSIISNGFTTGTAQAPQLNKVWRQSSIIAAMIGAYINDRTGLDALDDGTTATLLTNFKAAVVRQITDTAPLNLGLVSGTDTLTATPSPAITAYTARIYTFISAGANTTTTVTLNLNGLGAKNITKNGTTPLAIGDIPAGVACQVIYDGTRFQLVAVPKAVSLGTAAALNVGTGANNVVQLNGSGLIPAIDGSLLTNLMPGDYLGYSANQTIVAAQAGKTIYGQSASAITFTLPAATTVLGGKKFEFWNWGPGSLTITRTGADVLLRDVANNYTSIVLAPGDILELESGNSSNYYVITKITGVARTARAWVNFAGATGTIQSAFNVSSVTRNSTGDYTVNIAAGALIDGNYSVSSNTSGLQGAETSIMIKAASTGGAPATKTTTALRITATGATGFRDEASISLNIFGN